MTDLNALTQGRLQYLLKYDAATGEFVWLNGRGPVAKHGTPAGWVTPAGYLMIKVDGVNYWAHRLAWLYVTGEWPKEMLDHKDTKKSNNRFDNLREATRSQNKQNTGRQAHNTSGYKGVSFNKSMGRWVSWIRCNGSRYYVGSFKNAEEAYSAYCNRATELHGEFARVA